MAQFRRKKNATVKKKKNYSSVENSLLTGWWDSVKIARKLWVK